MMITRTDALHDALDRLSGHGFVDGPGLACHGPMGAEALSALGYDELVPQWVAEYAATHPPVDRPPTHTPIGPADERDWQDALGDFSRVSDWLMFFEDRLTHEPWETVVGEWVAVLLPGYGGGLTHGLLRTAHAVRMIDGRTVPSPAMRNELASGLASWAAWHQPLPGRPQLAGRLSLDGAIAALPHRAEPWTPFEAGSFSRLGEVVDFPRAVDQLAPPTSAVDALSDMSVAACRLVLVNPDATPTGLVHALTPIAAARSLLPLADRVTVADAHRYLWQVMAALAVGFTDHRPMGAVLPEGWTPPDPGTVAERAAGHPDPHVIKFTEACLREHAHRPDPVYLAAAAALIDRMESESHQ